MKKLIPTFLLLLTCFAGLTQNPTNILLTNPKAENILLGKYTPSNWASSNPITNPDDIICIMMDELSSDSLHSYLVKLGSFHNRNTGSDTMSADTGIGAARRWAHQLFQKFSMQQENRLVVSYLQFDEVVCGMGQHRNTLAILPGSDAAADGIIVIEGHMDSRCEDGCDINCKAHGSDDNGSGTALVIELARVMSQFTFDRTIVFMLTTGEEQGLLGANAFAQYCQDSSIAIKAVQNNDVVGGIICGETSSPPSCPSDAHIDSTQVRIFSLSQGGDSQHRGYARFAKIMYQERLEAIAKVAMTVSIINQEDRTGRGGDHIPFSDRAMTAIRFTSANEHGNGNPTAPGYNDHQHTSNDTLGADTNNDGKIDSFFVDFNYLRRNASINGVTMAMAAMSPQAPEFALVTDPNEVFVHIITQQNYPSYRVGVRQNPPTDFEAVYEFQDTIYSIPNLMSGTSYWISVAGIDANGNMSFFANEQSISPTVTTPTANIPNFPNKTNCAKVGIQPNILKANAMPVVLLPAFPNPFANNTTLGVQINDVAKAKGGYVVVNDVDGREVARFPLQVGQSVNTFSFKADQLGDGVYFYSLMMDGVVLQTEKLLLLK